jgi:hypothetical protein
LILLGFSPPFATFDHFEGETDSNKDYGDYSQEIQEGKVKILNLFWVTRFL